MDGWTAPYHKYVLSKDGHIKTGENNAMLETELVTQKKHITSLYKHLGQI